MAKNEVVTVLLKVTALCLVCFSDEIRVNFLILFQIMGKFSYQKKMNNVKYILFVEIKFNKKICIKIKNIQKHNSHLKTRSNIRLAVHCSYSHFFVFCTFFLTSEILYLLLRGFIDKLN